jgi:hypothetical protein
MRSFALITLAATFALTGAVVPAAAALDWRGTAQPTATASREGDVQVAARGGDNGGRNEGRSRDARRGDRKDQPVWRIKDRHLRERPFFLFRGRGDCDYVRVRQADGSLSKKVTRVCN